MLRQIKNYLAKHYMMSIYMATAVLMVLFTVFRNNVLLLLQMLASLVVMFLYILIGSLAYIFVKAIFADRHFDRGTLRNILVLVAVLALLYPILAYALNIPDINSIYLLAPIASWPAILAVLILNISTRWARRRENRRKRMEEKKAGNV